MTDRDDHGQEFLTGELLAHRYHLDKLLGTGGMGQVYLAHDTACADQPVAVKLLKDRETVEWFKREFETLSLMLHPNIARVFDFGRDRERDLPFYTCEFVSGRPAEEALDGAPFSEKLEVFLQVLTALQYIHGQGYLHCDVKPQNVLVEVDAATGHRRAKVLDFGLAMAIPRSSMTARGTFSYMAPEWLEGGVPGAYTDIYSTGIMFYQATYGTLPFQARDSASCIEFHTKGEVSFPKEAQVPEWWPKIIRRMCSREIADRYGSARECLGAIQRLGGADVPQIEAGSLVAETGVGGPWVGRAEVLLQVRNHLNGAWQRDLSHGPLVLVEGDDGIGKSRFLGEVKRRMQLAGVTVVPVSAGPPQGAFGPLSARIAQLAGETAPPVVQERIEHVVHRRVQQALSHAADRPLLFLVDDAPLLEEAAQAFFAALVNAQEYAVQTDSPPLRLAIVATGPCGGPLPGPLAGREGGNRLRLTPLSGTESGRLLRLALGVADLPSELEEEAATVCGGTPRLLQEFALLVKDCGALEFTPTGVQYHRDRLPAGGVPSSVEQYLRQAWSTFGDLERRLLTSLSLLFCPQPLPLLAQVAELDVWQVDQLVAQLAERGLVTFERLGERELPTLESAILRRLAASDLSRSATRAWHERLAAALEAQPAGRNAHNAGAVAYHWFQAGKAARARKHALGGVDAELAACNFPRAVELAEIARETDAPPLDVAERYAAIYRLWGRYDAGIEALKALTDRLTEESEYQQVQIQLAELYFRSGKYDDARALVEPLSESEEGAHRGAALALLARVHFYSGRHGEARLTGERGMLNLDSGSRDFALCAAMVGLARVYEGKLQQGAKYLETACSVLEGAGSGSDRAFAANATGLAYHKLKDYAKATESYQRSLDVARQTGDMERINIASMNLSVVHQETGNYGEAISRYEEALAMAFRSGNEPVLARVYNNLGNIHRYLGMLEKASDFAERSIALADGLGLGLSQGLDRMLLGEILTLQGRHDDAWTLFEEARGRFDEAGAADELMECDIDRVEWHLARNEWGEAIQLGRKTVERARELKLDNHRLRALVALAIPLLQRRDAGDAGEALALLDEAIVLLPVVGNAELEFRVHALQAHALTALAEGEKAAIAMARAEQALATLRQRIPEEFHAVFFKRTDRKRLLDDFAGLSSRMAQLAQTISPMAPSTSRFARRNRWMTELIRMNERLVAEHDLEKLLGTLIDVIVDLSGAERGFVILGSQSALDVVVARNMDREAIRRSRTKFSTTIARRVLEHGELIRLEDAIEADDYRSKESVMALRIRSVICLPVVGKGETIGAIYLDNRFKPGVFSESVIEMLTAFAEQAAIAIQNARLLARYRETVEQLRHSEEEVKRLNERLEEKVKFQKMVIDQKTEELDRRQEQLEERYRFSSIVGRSRSIEALFSVMQRVCQTHVPVLITGESGSGKELVARALHFSGPRRKQQYLSINCAALPDALLESELFGYCEGAFTDARRDKKGLFAMADGGTLFLDEVGDMSLTMQAKLLRVLQEGEFAPLGAEQVMKVDVRIVAATNRDLKAMVKAGTFRQDLYYRLDVVSIRVPPLRERKEDIPLLVEHFLDAFAQRSEQERTRMSLQAMQVLMAYHWPGNVRELQSVVTTSAVFADEGVVTTESLRTKPEVFAGAGHASSAVPNLETLNLRDLEKQAVILALRRTEGNKQKAAKVLGISRRALYNKLEAYGIESDKIL